MVQRFDIQRQKQLAWGLLILIMLLYAADMSYQSVLRYETFKATAFDLGNMDQVIWNTLHGRFFQFTNQAIDWYGPPTRLAIHFEPILLPLSLLYVFHADPRILLVFQTLALTTGALPVFLLTRKYLAEWPLMAPMMVIAYFLSPALLGLNIFDFHPYALATPFLLYAVLALTYRRYGWMLLCCVLACSCKEDVPLTVAMLGVLVIWKYKLPRLGTVLLVGGLLWSFVAFEIIIPHFYPGAQGNNFWYRYLQLGSTPLAAILNILIHPWIIFTTFLTIERFYYVAGLLRSAGFLSLLAPEWLLPALPSIAVNALSTDSLTYSGIFHYNATIIPFVTISAIHGTRRLITTWQVWRGERTVKVRFDQSAPEGVETQPPAVVVPGSTEAQASAIAGPETTVAQPPVVVVPGSTVAQPSVVAVPGSTVGKEPGYPRGDTPTIHAVAMDGRGIPLRVPWSLIRVSWHTFTTSIISLYLRIEGWITKVFLALWRFTRRVAQRAGRTGWYRRVAAFTRKTWAAFIVWFSFQWRRFSERMVPLAKSLAVRNLQWVIFPWIVFMLVLNLLLIAPSLNYFWADHTPGSREQHIQLLLNKIPPNASVSASDDLNPHLSERQYIFVFPSFTDSTHNFSAQYIIVDLDNVLPQSRNDVTNQLNQLVSSGQYKVIGHAENVLLLEKVAQSG